MTKGKTLSSVVLILVCLIPGLQLANADTIETPQGDTLSAASTDTLGVTASTDASQESLYPLSPERKARLISYSQFKNVWRFVDFFIGLALLSLVLFTGLSAKLKAMADRARFKFFVYWLYLLLFLVVMYVLSFPFDYYRQFVVESDYGFMNQTFGEWLVDSFKGLGITAVIGIIPLWFLYFMIERTRRWWLWFTLGSIPLLILLIVIAPVFIAPMFNEFTPLEDKQLESKLLTLASKAGIEGSDVFQVDASRQTSKISAYVTGLFDTKRIVLYDTIIENFEDDEILFVMGHEMGHYVMNHLWLGIGLAVIIIGFSLWLVSLLIERFIRRFEHRLQFSSLSNVASLPLVILALSIISFFTDPFSNGVSRYMEHKSDAYGMEITGVDGESAAIAFDKLSAFNLSDPDPHPIIEFWFYDHPSLKKRMEFVRGYGH